MMMMNQLDNSANAQAANSMPLFASSWVALFFVIRHSINNRSGGQATPVKVPESDHPRTHH